MGKLLESKSLNIPESATLEGCKFDLLPYFLLGDEMRPFPGRLDQDEKVSTTGSREEEEL